MIKNAPALTDYHIIALIDRMAKNSTIKPDFFDSVDSSLLTENDLSGFVQGYCALLFRIDLAKNRIEYLNDYKLESLGGQSSLLLKSPEFSRKVIDERDYPAFEAYIRSIYATKDNATIFRVKNHDNTVSWLRVSGCPNSFEPGFYIGMLEDVSGSVTSIEQIIDEDSDQQTMLAMFDNPVFLVDFENKSILSQNSAAIELFGYSIDEFRNLKFSNLYHPGFKGEMIRIIEEIVFEKKWDGKILFRRKNKKEFLGKVTLRYLRVGEMMLLRVSIYSVERGQHQNQTESSRAIYSNLSDKKKKHVKMLLSKIKPISDIKDSLELFLENPFANEKYDGILYSNILLKKGEIVVYGAGKPFEKLPFGDSFSYEGTIAENIEQYKLDYLIVDDTMASIKAIDWALFIPYGIRSYFAKPFYERNVLRSVLILCSTKPNMFSEDKLEEYSLLDVPFIKGLKNWRKASRFRKPKK